MATPSDRGRERVLSGMRPTGKLHLGHKVGALDNWVSMQEKFDCYFFIADWHALTTHYADTSQFRQFTKEVMLDYLAAGLDPGKSVIFLQSHIPEHAELHLLLSQVIPLGWLERVPTYKEQQEQLRDKDLNTYGFLGYPVLQAADIFMYKADFVPVGEDQVSHLELTREICRRFNNFYGPLFPEPRPLLTEMPRLPGTDGRKMSKSYGNAIYLSDSEQQIRNKVSTMLTDPARQRRSDPGNPDICPVFAYHKLVSPQETIAMVDRECRCAGIGCVDDKKLMADNLVRALAPLQDRRRQFETKPSQVWEILEEGSRKARQVAHATMEEVRAAMNLNVPLAAPEPAQSSGSAAG
ncbi:MAG: tryptophan--tRNA ligase [Acidobacteria bacterium]|nr:tryptophan--tRNA ligase [Acidobacteriota bacterium]